MRVADRLAQREASWRELDACSARLDSQPMRRRRRRRRCSGWASSTARACTDLMLAEAHDLPRDTVAYLHGLVGRAHNAVYRARGFRFSDWARDALRQVPRRLRDRPGPAAGGAGLLGRRSCICALLAAGRPGFAAKVIGEPIRRADGADVRRAARRRAQGRRRAQRHG